MPQTIKQDDFNLLAELDSWVREHRKEGALAALWGKPQSRVSELKARYGLKSVSGQGLVSRHTGETLNQGLESGTFALPVIEEPAQEPAAV